MIDKARKNIIVNEILYWKKSRMLPEQYCDYLLALYTEGNQPKGLRKENKRKKIQLSNILFLLLIPISVFLIYFTGLSIILQTAFSILFIFKGFLLIFYFSRKGILLHIPIISSALILLLITVELVSKLYPDQSEILYFSILINCIIWIISGWKLKLLYLSISGYIGNVLLIISIFI